MTDMAQTAIGLDVFDRTIQKTYTWIHDVTKALGSEDRHMGYLALRATLHALRDRITVEEVAQLGAQLPMLIRGFYYEEWDPTRKPVKIRHRYELLARIENELRDADAKDPERVARAVFTVLSQRIAQGEIEDVKHVLPGEVRDLWPRG
jgi:uncharacterized protein (DUF2267 family)